MILRTPQMTSGQLSSPNEKRAPVSAGLSAAARLRGTAVMLAAAARSGGVTTAITYEERGGTSICDSAARANRHASAISSDGATAATIRNTLAGMCVNTIVLTSPIRRAIQAATGNENADSSPDQKKKTPAAVSDRPKRSNSHSASSECTTKPPANASRLNRAARRNTVCRDGP